MMSDPPPDSTVLGRILLLLNAMEAVPDIRRLAELVVGGLTEIPGVAGCMFCSEGTILSSTVGSEISLSEYNPLVTTDDTLSETQLVHLLEKAGKTIRRFVLETSTQKYGVFIVVLNDRERFEFYDPFIANTINLVTLHIETHQSLEALQAINLELNDRARQSTSQLRLKEAHLKKIERLSKTGGWEWDIETECLHWSDEVYRILGIPPDATIADSRELIARGLRGFRPEQRQIILEAFNRCAEIGEPYDLEFEIETENGYRKWIRTVAEPEYENGRIVKVVGNIMDITEHRERENRSRILAELMETLPASITVHDFEGNFLYVNRRTAELHGYTYEELLRGSLNQLDDPSAMQYVPERMREIRENGEAFFEVKHLRKDGSQLPLQVNAKRIRWNNQDAVLSIALDITERKLAVQALRDEKERIATLLVSTGDMIAAMDGDYTILFMSGELVKDFGERTGEKCYRVFCGFDRPCGVNCSVDEVIKKQKDSFEYFHDDEEDIREGRIVGDVVSSLIPYNRVLETVAHPFEYQGKRCVIEVSRDITERKRAEEALRSSEIRFRQLAETVPLGIEEVDLTGQIEYVNPSYCRMIDCTPEEAIQRYVWEFAVDRDPLRNYIKYLAETRPRPETWFGKNYTKHRGTIDVRVDWDYRRDLQGDINGFIAVITDITEQVNLEAQLRQAQKMDAVGRLAGGVAHDFNNMLQTIIGYSDIALARLMPVDPLYENLVEIQKAAQRSADLTRQLLAFARKQTAIPKELDLNETIAGMLKMLQRLIGEAIDLVWIPGHSLWNVKIDPSQVDQILANLTVNARDAIDGVGTISIETANSVLDKDYCDEHAGAVPGEYVVLIVRDTGAGMARETMAKIFEPIFTTKGVGEGTGLGLATVYGIVKQNDGFIDVTSELGKGSTFVIYLPHCLSHSADLSVETRPIQPPGGQETILIVEDEITILDLAKTILEELGYTVLTASNPTEAIRKVSDYTGDIHLLVSDMVMPHMNGRDLAQALETARPGLKCLFMSGYAAEVMTSRGMMDPGKSFLQKPFKIEELAGKVREVLDR